MSEPTGRGYKTLAVRLPDELHAQLVLIAGLGGLSLNDAIREAVQELVDRKRGDKDLAAQAAQALEEMEQESATKRQALQALLGPPPGHTGEVQDLQLGGGRHPDPREHGNDLPIPIREVGTQAQQLLGGDRRLSLIHISEPTRLGMIS